MIGTEVYCDEKRRNSGSEAEMDKKLSHFPRNIRRRFERMLQKSGLLDEYVFDPRFSDVPIRHHFELKTDAPVYSKGIRQSPKHNRIIWEELQKMLNPGVIVPATSEWASAVVTDTKKYGHPRFFVNCRVLKHVMKGDRWPISKIQEIFGHLIGAPLFTTLDIFSGYWQIKLSKC